MNSTHKKRTKRWLERYFKHKEDLKTKEWIERWKELINQYRKIIGIELEHLYDSTPHAKFSLLRGENPVYEIGFAKGVYFTWRAPYKTADLIFHSPLEIQVTPKEAELKIRIHMYKSRKIRHTTIEEYLWKDGRAELINSISTSTRN